MKNIADLIQTGLLAVLGDDERMTPEGRYIQAQQSGLPSQVGNRFSVQKQPNFSSPQQAFGIQPSEVNNLGYLPGQPRENSIRLLHSSFQQPLRAQAVQSEQEPFYMVGRRPLGKSGGVGNYFFNGPKWGVGSDHNLRLEHQHFMGSNGSNFGFTDTGEFEEKDREKDYSYDVPNIGNTKFKAKYMDMARLMVSEQMQSDSDQMKEIMESFSIEDGEYLVNSYHAYFNNCQDYVDNVIRTARELAKRNGDTLEIR